MHCRCECHHRHPPSSSIIANSHPSSPNVIYHCHPPSSSSSIIVIHHRHLSLSSIIVIHHCHHHRHPSSTLIIAIHHRHWSSAPIITITVTNIWNSCAPPLGSMWLQLGAARKNWRWWNSRLLGKAGLIHQHIALYLYLYCICICICTSVLIVLNMLFPCFPLRVLATHNYNSDEKLTAAVKAVAKK